MTKGLLYVPEEESTHLYLKKERPDDPSTREYNNAVQGIYAGLLKDQTALSQAKQNSTTAANKFKKIFDEKFDFENQRIESIAETGRSKSKPADVELTKVKKNYKRASVAWENKDVQIAYEEYVKAADRYTTLKDASKGEGLNQNGILYVFYTRSVFSAGTPKAKVYAYSGGQGICFVFGVALQDQQPSDVAEKFGKKTPEVVKEENLKVILHELGHSTGLLHSFDAKDIYDGLPAMSNEEIKNKENKKRLYELEGDKEEGDLGEIKITEQKLEVMKSKDANLARANQLQTLKEYYDELARRLRTTGEPIIIEVLNLITEKSVPLEEKLSSESTTIIPIDEALKKQEIEQLQKELEAMKKELEEKKKQVKEAKILPYGKEQGKTIENYLDYNQDSKGTPFSEFNRKSFYWWQWEVMRPGKRGKNKYLVAKAISSK